MILRHEQNIKQNDIEVFITYPQKNLFVEQLLTLVKSVDIKITCYFNDEINIVTASEINYIESVDKKTIVNCEGINYKTNEPLYQIYEKLKSNGFIQINKYCILNLNKLKTIKQLPNSHLEAVLKNEMRLYVTRKYLNDLKNILREKH